MRSTSGSDWTGHTVASPRGAGSFPAVLAVQVRRVSALFVEIRLNVICGRRACGALQPERVERGLDLARIHRSGALLETEVLDDRARFLPTEHGEPAATEIAEQRRAVPPGIEQHRSAEPAHERMRRIAG